MTYTIIAHENTRARLIDSETRTTDATLAEMIATVLRDRGLIVVVSEES